MKNQNIDDILYMGNDEMMNYIEPLGDIKWFEYVKKSKNGQVIFLDQVKFVKFLNKFANTWKVKQFQKMAYEFDLWIRNTEWIKEQGWVPHTFNLKRTVFATFGAIEIKRTKYRNTITNEFKCLVDQFLGLEKNYTATISLKLEVFKLLKEGIDTRTISKILNNSTLKEKTYSNIIGELDVNTIETHATKNLKKLESDSKYIYLEVDDGWVTTKNKKLMSRIVIQHTGKKDKKYLNKRVFVIFKEKDKNILNGDELVNWITEKLNENYIDVKNKKTVVCGDGAKWIKNIATIMDAEIVLDKFHLSKKMYSAFSYRKGTKNSEIKEAYLKIAEMLLNDDLQQIQNYITSCESIYQDYKNHFAKIKKVKKLNSYIKANWKGILSHREDFYVGCNVESSVSQILKSKKGGSNKRFGFKATKTAILFRVAKENGVDIIEKIKEDYDAKAMKEIYRIKNIKKFK